MSVFAILTAIVLIGLIIGGLYLSRLATLKQMEQQEVRSRLRQRRMRLSESEELFSTLMIYDRNPGLLETLQRLMVREAETMLELAPDDATSRRDVEYYQGLKQDIDQLGERANQPEIPGSDRQINIMKRHFGRTMKYLRTLTAQGEVTELDCHEHLARLRRNSLVLEVEAYKLQGVRARQNGDLSTAASYFKHAKDMLINTDISFDDKPQQIRAISRKISGLYSSEFEEDEASDNDSQSESDKA